MSLPAGQWQLCAVQPATADYEGHASWLDLRAGDVTVRPANVEGHYHR